MNKISYEELDTIVSLYQDGSEDAAELLVQQFDGYFKKFLNVLHYKKFTIGDKTERNFAKLFVKNGEARKKVSAYRHSDYIRRVLYITVLNVREKLTHLEADELRNEMVCLFLKMARKHDGSAPFGIFLSRYFPMQLQSIIIKFMDEVDNREEIPYDEEISPHYDEIDLDAIDEIRYYIDPTTPTDFDENWINGYTCGDLFKGLSPYERRILKWYYEWKTLDKKTLPSDIFKERKIRLKKTEDDIADILGCSRKTVNLKRNIIKREVEDAATYLHLIQGSPLSPTV